MMATIRDQSLNFCFSLSLFLSVPSLNIYVIYFSPLFLSLELWLVFFFSLWSEKISPARYPHHQLPSFLAAI